MMYEIIDELLCGVQCNTFRIYIQYVIYVYLYLLYLCNGLCCLIIRSGIIHRVVDQAVARKKEYLV